MLLLCLWIEMTEFEWLRWEHNGLFTWFSNAAPFICPPEPWPLSTLEIYQRRSPDVRAAFLQGLLTDTLLHIAAPKAFSPPWILMMLFTTTVQRPHS